MFDEFFFKLQDSSWDWVTEKLAAPLHASWLELKKVLASEFGKAFIDKELPEVKKSFKDSYESQCAAHFPVLNEKMQVLLQQIQRMYTLHRAM